MPFETAAQFVAYVAVLVIYGLIQKWYTDRQKASTVAKAATTTNQAVAEAKSQIQASVGEHIADLEATVQRQSIEITDLKEARERHRREIDDLRNEKGAVTVERDELHRKLTEAQGEITDLKRRVTELEIEKRIWEAKDRMWAELLAKITVVAPPLIAPPTLPAPTVESTPEPVTRELPTESSSSEAKDNAA